MLDFLPESVLLNSENIKHCIILFKIIRFTEKVYFQIKPEPLRGIRKWDLKRGELKGDTLCGFHLLFHQSRNTNEV